jgi:hypothetical protein
MALSGHKRQPKGEDIDAASGTEAAINAGADMKLCPSISSFMHAGLVKLGFLQLVLIPTFESLLLAETQTS